MSAKRTTTVSRRGRRGATLLETAIAISLFLTLVLGMVDLGYGVFKQHVLSQAARQVARTASVRGQLADRLDVWGPDEVDMQADGENEVVEATAQKLVGWKLEEVNVHISWPDGSNDARRSDRVKVELSAPYRPTLGFVVGNPNIVLRGSSTMYISH